jgi:hypothetical protein
MSDPIREFSERWASGRLAELREKLVVEALPD